MENLYYETNNLISETQGYFQQLERAFNQEVEFQIQVNLEKINKNCDKLDTFVYKAAPNQRQTAKLRVDQLKYDNKHLQSALRVYQNRRLQQLNEQRDRELLLNSTFVSNDNTTINIDYSLQQNTSLNNVHRGVDDMLSSGHSILDSLRNQQGTLKGAKRRILDMGHTLGLSNHTMRLIERRVFQDKFVLYGGMTVTIIIILIIIYYFA